MNVAEERVRGGIVSRSKSSMAHSKSSQDGNGYHTDTHASQ